MVEDELLITEQMKKKRGWTIAECPSYMALLEVEEEEIPQEEDQESEEEDKGLGAVSCPWGSPTMSGFVSLALFIIFITDYAY